MKIYQQLSSSFQAYNNCLKSNNTEWEEKHYDKILTLIDQLPHGSGIDGKTELDFEKSNNNKLVINSEFHHMDENGYYDGWINFSLTIEPGWDGVDITIKGNFGKYQDLKDYLIETFGYELEKEIQ
jgi:hypothetical protein